MSVSISEVVKISLLCIISDVILNFNEINNNELIFLERSLMSDDLTKCNERMVPVWQVALSRYQNDRNRYGLKYCT